MRKTSSFLVLTVLLGLAAMTPAVLLGALAAPQGTELWGGPGAKGTGNQSARFDTVVYVTGPAPAVGAVEFLAGGKVLATVPFTFAANGVALVPAPEEVAEKGAFLYHVRSDVPVSAWSETYNDASAGRYGVSLGAAAPSELLGPGDEATGGGAEASSESGAGHARTNAGVVCVDTASQPCRLEVALFSSGALVGSGTIEAAPGSAAQSSLATLVPAAVGKAGLALRLRLLSGQGYPYAIRNDNQTSDGTAIPLAVKRNAFSTAPTIASFTASPATGCAPLETTFSWETSGAAKVSIAGVGNDLPASGSVKTTVHATGDFILTATSSTGQAAIRPLRITITPSTPPPTPAPASATLPTSGVVTGILPVGTGPVTVEFVSRESTGSTFTVQGTSFIYTAGTTPGTDVVKITATGSCGGASAEFTAHVVLPGAPRILSFEAIPERGCAPSTNFLLTWRTENAIGVNVAGIEENFVANGGVEVTLTATTSFVLTAFSLDGTEATATVTVPIDPQLYVPTITPGAVAVAGGTQVVIDVNPASVPSLDGVRFAVVQYQSRGIFSRDLSVPGRFIYRAGPYTGIDIIRILWVNGCGIGYTDFTANVTGENPAP